MPRDGGGIYSLPAGNPVVPGTIIESNWANPTMQDLGVAMSDSLSRSGKGGMTAPLRGPDGSAGVPTFSFTNEVDTGRYRAGPGQVVESVQGQPVLRWTASGVDQWNVDHWEPLTPRDAAGTPFDPDPTALTSTNVQDAIEEVFGSVGGVPTADGVTYDDSNVYFPAFTVQIALDRLGLDLGQVATDVAAIDGDITQLEGEMQIINDQVLANIDAINKNEADIGVLGTRIDNVETVNSQQDGDIANLVLENTQQDGDIADNAQDITNLSSRVTNTENDINNLENDVFTLGVDLNSLTSRVSTIESWFTGTVLKVSKGGTGVTSSTGTGSVVLNNGPYINGGTIENLSLNNVDVGGWIDLGNNATTATKSGSDNDTSVASTAMVQAAIALAGSGGGGDITMESGAGSWVRWKRGSTTVLQVCWGNALYGNTGNKVISFPKTFPSSGNVRVFLQMYGSAIAGGRNYAPTISAMSSSSFTYGSSYDCIYFAIGF
ncbi:hypothetical protein N9937_01315 [bacterium]|nr:hypothetical protein [bacterium]